MAYIIRDSYTLLYIFVGLKFTQKCIGPLSYNGEIDIHTLRYWWPQINLSTKRLQLKYNYPKKIPEFQKQFLLIFSPSHVQLIDTVFLRLKKFKITMIVNAGTLRKHNQLQTGVSGSLAKIDKIILRWMGSRHTDI